MTKNLNNSLNPREEVLGSLLNAAAKKLGCDPKALKKGLETGDLSGMGSNSSVQELRRLMNDPKAVNKLMSDPKATELLKKLTEK